MNDCVEKFFVIKDDAYLLAIEKPMISFKEAHFPKDVILSAVFSMFTMVSYRDQKEIIEELGVNVDHAILNRCVVDYSHSIQHKPKNAKCCCTGLIGLIEISQVNNLNNVVEQDHRFIKKIPP